MPMKKSSRLSLLIFSVFVLLIVGMNYFFDRPIPVTRYGFINKKGQLVIPQEFDSVWDFHQGLAAVKKNKRLFMIDTNGKEVNKTVLKYTVDTLPLVPLDHAHRTEYKCGKLAEQLPVWREEGSRTLYRKLDTIIYNSKNAGHHTFYIYFFRKDSLAPVRMYSKAYPFSEGFALVRGGMGSKSTGGDTYYRFVDASETFVVSTPYSEAHSFSGGFAAVGSSMKDPAKH
jgi:hypothetical protein